MRDQEFAILAVIGQPAHRAAGERLRRGIIDGSHEDEQPNESTHSTITRRMRPRSLLLVTGLCQCGGRDALRGLAGVGVAQHL